MRTRYVVTTIAALAVLAGPVAAEAQQWSSAQQEVWKAVSEMVGHFYNNEIAEGYEYVHPEFVWWNNGNDVPGSDYELSKNEDTIFAAHARKWLSGSCTPLTIQAFDTFAVVNCYCRGYREAAAGQDPQWRTMRALLVMKKEGGKWLQVSNYIDFTQR